MPAPTPFDPEKLGLSLSTTARLWRTKLDQRLRPLGLSQGKWTTLVHLARAGGPITQRELAARVGIEAPTLAGILHRLQSDGWIKRQESATDRRCKTVHLRQNSQPILEQIFSTARELRHEMLADIPADELQTCMKVLEDIRTKARALPMHSNGNSATKSNGAPKRVQRSR